MTSSYAFGNALGVQRQRLRALETALDPGTMRHLEACGVRPGWRCLEVGAGSGSIAAWLCDRAGPTGSIVATDVDTTVLGTLAAPNLEVRVHDVADDDLPAGEFDLVHVRLLLAWLPDPLAALGKLARALKPGGWLVAEEMDFVSVVPDPRLDDAERALFARVVAVHTAVLSAQHVFDPAYGRRLIGDVADQGLTGVDGEGRTAIWRGARAGGTVLGLTLIQLREAMIDSELVAARDVDAAIALCSDPNLSFFSPTTMAVWGRRPVQPGRFARS